MLPCIRRVIRTLETRSEPDQELLDRFVAQRDEAAFATLVHRHGPMVLRVARRTLHNEHDAEDVFQATFLVLSRKAPSVQRQESLASWLYGVAYRLALKTRATAIRRRNRDSRAVTNPTAPPLAHLTVQEAQTIVDEELSRLPEKLRAPVVLCCLEGLARDEAARHIGCAASVLKSRLEQARERLRQRLVARGLTLPCGFGAVLLTEGVAGAAVPSALIGSTVKAALTLAAGGAAASVVSARVAALAEGTLRATLVGKAGALAALVLGIGILAVGAGVGARHEQGPLPGAQEKPKVKGGVTARTDAHGDPLPVGAAARLGSLRFRQGGDIGQIAFSADGKVLAAASDDAVVCLWDAVSGQELRRFRQATGGFNNLGVAFSPDGKVLATARFEAILRWEWRTGAELPRFSLKSAWAGTLLFSPDGKILASIGRDPSGKGQAVQLNVVTFLDAVSGKELHRLVGLKIYDAPRIAFSPDSRTVAYADRKAAAVRLLDSRTGKAVRTLEGHTEAAWTVAFSPDGKVLASTTRDHNTLRFWDVATGKPLPGTGRFRACHNLSYSHDGKFLVGGGEDDGSGPNLYDLATGKEINRIGPGDEEGHDVLTSPDGKLFATANRQALRLWDATTHKSVLPISGHEQEVCAVAFSPDGNRVFSAAGEPGIVHAWDTATGKPLAPLRGFRDFVYALACSPDGRLLAVGTGDHEGTVWLLEAATGRQVRKLVIPRGYVASLSLAFSADGKTLISRHQDQTHVWDTETGKLRSVVRAGASAQTVAALSPDGRTIAVVLDDFAQGFPHPIRVWEAATGKELLKLDGHTGFTNAVTFSPAGTTLASGGDDGTVRLWDVAGRKQLWQASGHEGWVRFVAFSADGKTVASGGEDGSVCLWEAATGKQRWRFQGHRHPVRTGAFSMDGRLLATGSADTTVLLWDLAPHVGNRPPGPLSARELDGLWADLAGDDARRAYLAIAALARSAPQSVLFLKRHLAPVPKADGRRIARLIAGLDSDRFAEREKATSELLKLGEPATPAIRAALESDPSLEVRRRLKGILSQLEAWGPQRLRTWRAIEALERIGTQEVRQVLKVLAEDGAPGAWMTQESTAALARLAKRPLAPHKTGPRP